LGAFLLRGENRLQPGCFNDSSTGGIFGPEFLKFEGSRKKTRGVVCGEGDGIVIKGKCREVEQRVLRV
jgi:hypothetical protein